MTSRLLVSRMQLQRILSPVLLRQGPVRPDRARWTLSGLHGQPGRDELRAVSGELLPEEGRHALLAVRMRPSRWVYRPGHDVLPGILTWPRSRVYRVVELAVQRRGEMPVSRGRHRRQVRPMRRQPFRLQHHRLQALRVQRGRQSGQRAEVWSRKRQLYLQGERRGHSVQQVIISIFFFY